VHFQTPIIEDGIPVVSQLIVSE